MSYYDGQIRSYYEVKAVSATAINTYASVGFLPQLREQTEAMSIGTGLHSYLLEGKNNFFSCDARTKVGKEIIAANPNGIRVPEDFLARLPELKSSFEKALSLINGSEMSFERELYTEVHGIPAKAKVDIMGKSDGIPFIAELKTVSTFEKIKAREKSYKRQLGWYSLVQFFAQGLDPVKKYIIFLNVETAEALFATVLVTQTEIDAIVDTAYLVWEMMVNPPIIPCIII
jgi:hypothetical protein